METAAPRELLERRSTFSIVSAVALVLFGITNLPWQLGDYDQAKQAFTSLEMVQEGGWLYQRTPNEFVATKPPAVGWISAGSFALTRSWDLSWRLPSFIAALTLMALLAGAAKNAYGTTAALLATGAFAFNLMTPRLATLVRTDMPLALVIFLLGWKIWEKIRRRETWDASAQGRMFLLLTGAMLIKGPIVFAFLFPGIVLFQLRSGRLRHNASAWFGLWPWLLSLAVFALWCAGGILFVNGFYEQVVLREFAGRFDGETHRAQPIYFYVPHLLHKFAPWSLLLVGLAVAKLRAGKFREAWARISPETFWLVCWSLGGLVVMSLVPSKRVDRIFPVIPPLCLLLAAQFAEPWRDPAIRARARRWYTLSLCLAAIFTLGYSVMKIYLAARHPDELVAFSAAVRNEAQQQHWRRYEVMRGHDERLLVYLRRTHFIDAETAAAEWAANRLDAVVVPNDEVPRMLRELPGAIPASIELKGRAKEKGLYTVLKRSGPALSRGKPKTFLDLLRPQNNLA
ncbi:MAG: glycosyltransferase family 39 protein [Chthoniobacterales bacterium]